MSFRLFRKRSLLSNISLQWVLIVPFVAQVVAAVGLVGYLSYRSGQESVNKLASRLQTEINTRVMEKTTTYLQAINQTNKNNISALHRGVWSFDDFSSQERQAWEQMQLSSLSPMTIIGFGTPSGGHRAVERLKDGTFVIRAAENGGGRYMSFTTNPDGSPDQGTQTAINFDSRQRPWYQVAVQARKAAWTNVYPHIYTKELLVALAEPVYDLKNNEFLGVTYGLRTLEEISRFLRSIDIRAGAVFIMERDGTLVATSVAQKPYQLSKNAKDQNLLKAIDSPSLPISGATKYLRDRFGNLANISQSKQFDFVINGDRQLVQAIPIHDQNGLDWLIVVVIPESDFMAEIQTNRTWTILLCGLALLLATGISIFTTRWITRPILQLSLASEAIARGEWQESLSENIAIAELKTLSISFNQMAAQVRESFERVQAALQESTEKYRTLFQILPIGIAITDDNGKIIESNPASAKILGIPTEELSEHTCDSPKYQLIRPDNSPLPLEEYTGARALREKRFIGDVEVGFMHPNGSLRWLNESAIPIPLEQYGVVIAYMDISDRKAVEIALAKAKEAAEAGTRAKSAFLASMSHEIRTPMNGVLGMAQLLATTNLTDEQEEFVQTIQDCGDALLTIINDILDFSKIESGMLELETKPFSLINVVQSVCSLLSQQASQKEIALTYSLNIDPITLVTGDSSRLRQILLNLIGNAIKFTHQGSVSVSVSIYSLCHQTYRYELIFVVTDTGIGISSDRIGKLFQSFTQADASISRKYGGTGLGLAISKRLVELMGGTIWVESLGTIAGDPPLDWLPNLEASHSQGSTFYFTITLGAVVESESPPQFSLDQSQVIIASAKKSSLRILLAEDNEVNQKLALLFLQKLGYSADVANNGLEVLDMLNHQTYDVIFMDVQMPEMDGLTATQKIRQDFKIQPWIVAMTANALEGDRQMCLDTGMDDYISKPIVITEIVRTLSQYIQTQNS